MDNTYSLLETVLAEIERSIKDKVSADSLAKAAAISSVHLQRLFRFAFNQSIAAYIRARKLAASTADLFSTDLKVIDIASEYSFDYEQSYIRAFKREFGITPGEARDTGTYITVKPPLTISEKNRVSDGLIFAPDIIMMPRLLLVGRRHLLNASEVFDTTPKITKKFWHYDRDLIPDRTNGHVYIGVKNVTEDSIKKNAIYYLTSVQVSRHGTIPPGLEAVTLPASLCAKFRYIGRHHYFELNRTIAEGMYKAIGRFAADGESKYNIDFNQTLDRLDTAAYDGVYCQMEWIARVVPKHD